MPGAELDTLLAGLLTHDADAGIRTEAAATLGRLGSEKCLTALNQAARTDRTTAIRIGDVGGQSSARRAATFALANLAHRFPKLNREAADAIRPLPILPVADDPEGLSDARVQALYQVTRDDTLLAPFFQRLQSKDAQVRIHGIIAFRFLKLTIAPPQVVATLADPSADVRSWSALVLSEIADPQTAPALERLKNDPDANVRANAARRGGEDQ